MGPDSDVPVEITDDFLAKLDQAADTLISTGRLGARPRPKHALVMKLAPIIRKLRAKGAHWKQVETFLHQRNVNVTRKTIQTVMEEIDGSANAKPSATPLATRRASRANLKSRLGENGTAKTDSPPRKRQPRHTRPSRVSRDPLDPLDDETHSVITKRDSESAADPTTSVSIEQNDTESVKAVSVETTDPALAQANGKSSGNSTADAGEHLGDRKSADLTLLKRSVLKPETRKITQSTFESTKRNFG